MEKPHEFTENLEFHGNCKPSPNKNREGSTTTENIFNAKYIKK